jgi:TRAP-type C4-dicarboxylate transport system permease small subunit
MRETYVRAMDVVYLASIWMSGLALIVMTIVIPIGVFNRYVMGSGSQWPEPLAILCMVVFTFLGAAASYRAGVHIAVTMVTDRVPEQYRSALTLVVDALMAALCVFMIVYGWALCQVTWNQTIAEFPALSVGVTYLPLPVGAAVTLLFVIEQFFFGSQMHRPLVRKGDPSSEEVNLGGKA